MGNKLNRQEHKTHHTQRGHRQRRSRFLQKSKEKAPWERTETQTERRTIVALGAAFLLASRREITWSELFDAAVVVTGVDREEVFEPGNVWVGVTASSTEHGGGTSALHHLELGAHIYGGETWGQLILWNTGTPALLHTHTFAKAAAGTCMRNSGWRKVHTVSKHSNTINIKQTEAPNLYPSNFYIQLNYFCVTSSFFNKHPH